MDVPFADLVVAEWPAVLAVLILVGGHLIYLLVLEDGLRPLGVPFFVSISVFVLAELGRAAFARAKA